MTSVEELRLDVLNKKCRVNLSEVESMALQLSHLSKALAELKSGFPDLSEQMKAVMAAEIESVVAEEKSAYKPHEIEPCVDSVVVF